MGNSESMMENDNAENEIVSNTRNRRRRRRLETVTIAPDENSWWSTIENENLVLDRVPNELTSNSVAVSESTPTAPISTTTSMIDTVDAAIALETENLELSTTNLNIGQKFVNENVNLTLKRIESDTDEIENKKDEDNLVVLKNENATEIAERTERAAAREQSLEEFRAELSQKRLARQTAVQDLRDEISMLRKQLATEQALTQRLRQKPDDTLSVDAMSFEKIENVAADNKYDCVGDGVFKSSSATASASASTSVSASVSASASCCALNDADDADDVDPMSRGRHANIELANAQLALQLANSENISLRAELSVVQKQVGTLKEVISCCKQMLAVKEEQCNELKAKLTEIETSFGEREMKIMSENLRHEYERQLGNIRQLRELYEERQRISAAEHENLQRLISIKKDELLAEQEKTKNFEERNQTLIKEVENANNELVTLREECNEHKFEKRALKEEMGAVNTLFSQMVMGFNGKNNLDIDRLTTMLEENRTLLNDMATKESSCSDGATLPKLLFELVEQAMHSTNNESNGRSRCGTPTPTSTSAPIVGEKETEDKKYHNQHDDTETGAVTDKNNDFVLKHAEDSDAVNCALTDKVVMEQLNIATSDCNSSSINSKNSMQNQHQLRKMQTATSSSAIETVGNTTVCQHEVEAKAEAAALDGVTETALVSPANITMKFHEPEVIGKLASAQEIIGNLPKVWKVLMELLSHHKIEQTQFEENGNSDECYKSVETPNGPKAELSVSKTYIKLKDLILEKKSLVKETNRLKTLNSHLEYRLHTQEKRLSTVSMELTKTWHLVGKMQRQHRQLHTQEQILRYQLQQKRRLLSELKEELEYCRRKWAAARAKNDESQEQCNDLRREFARRKLEDANNSAESGYSDSGPPSDEEHSNGDIGDVADVGAVSAVNAVSTCNVNSRRKHLREMFEHTRKIKRMQSTSPGRAAAAAAAATTSTATAAGSCANASNLTQETEIVLRWNSAPPTCGWRRRPRDDEEHVENAAEEEDAEEEEEELLPRVLVRSRDTTRGAIAKQQQPQQVGNRITNPDDGNGVEVTTERATRIQRLEEQCKSLIQQVLETSDNRERLEIQLCRFQDEISPAQHAVPLEEFIQRRRTERMSRASSAPVQLTGSLTPREEEYTRKRSERLERLEEESRQLMSRIKRTSDRGHYLRCSLDRIRRVPSHENSLDNTVEDEVTKVRECDIKESSTGDNDEVVPNAESPLTPEEEAYTARRVARLKRLEEEGQQLLNTVSRNAQRGDAFEKKLDKLHERYGGDGDGDGDNKQAITQQETSKIVEIDSMPTSANLTQETQQSIDQRLESIDQVTTSRAERLRLLEEEGNQLIARLSSTSERGTRMINRIAVHEQKREARLNAMPSGALTDADNKSETKTTCSESGNDGKSVEEIATATALLPTLKNVACSSIVSDEVSECVTVITTPSQVAARKTGAIPKSKPTAQLCAARHKSERFAAEKVAATETNSTDETLENLVRRLQETPFPAEKMDEKEPETNSQVLKKESQENTDDELGNGTDQNDEEFEKN